MPFVLSVNNNNVFIFNNKWDCVFQLMGYNEPATLQVFIGSEVGRVKPHGFYQACKVCGKNSTQCTEREIEGTSVIEIEISPINDMQVK